MPPLLQDSQAAHKGTAKELPNGLPLAGPVSRIRAPRYAERVVRETPADQRHLLYQRCAHAYHAAIQ